MLNHCRTYAVWILFSGSLSAPLLAQPEVRYDSQQGGVKLIQKLDIGGRVKSTFVVTAKGARDVTRAHGSASGVLFQATARPDDSLRSLPVRLSYELKGEYDAVLHVTIGDHKLTSDAPAWVWAVAARFANHEATAAITMTDNPETPAEKIYERRWRTSNTGRLVWVRYHPEVDDMLVGFFLAASDAIAGDAKNIRTITDGLSNFKQLGSYSLEFDHAKSRQAARTLDGIISLKAKPGDYVMLNDVSEQFVFSAANGKLGISGSPRYHFGRKDSRGEFYEIESLTEICRKNHHLFVKSNPLIYKIVGDFNKHVAFFNYIRETERQQIDTLIARLQPVLDRIPKMTTPIAMPLSVRSP